MEFTGERLIPDQVRDDDLYHEHVVRYIFAAQLAGGRTVLDAGCGAGYGSAILARAGARHVLGVDIAPEAIAYARQHYHAQNVSFEVMDVRAMPLKDASFDLVAALEVIEHLAEQEAFVSEVRRVLKDNGVFVVSTPNTATYPPGNPFHLRELSLADFGALLGQFFPALAIFEEDYETAISVRPAGGAQPSGWTLVSAQEKVPRQGDYYLAVCTKRQHLLDEMIESARAVMYELPADRLAERISDAVTLQGMLEEKNAHIARLEGELRRQGQWAADLERQLLDIKRRWYFRVFGRRAR